MNIFNCCTTDIEKKTIAEKKTPAEAQYGETVARLTAPLGEVFSYYPQYYDDKPEFELLAYSYSGWICGYVQHNPEALLDVHRMWKQSDIKHLYRLYRISEDGREYATTDAIRDANRDIVYLSALYCVDVRMCGPYTARLGSFVRTRAAC